jgi:hypothetical protein
MPCRRVMFSTEPQCGHVGPFGHRIASMCSRAASSSWKIGSARLMVAAALLGLTGMLGQRDNGKSFLDASLTGCYLDFHGSRRTRHIRSSLASRSATGSARQPRARVLRRPPPRRQHPARLRPPPPRHRPAPRRRPHIPYHRGVLRHRQPLHHPGLPQPRHPACRSAAALPARARRNRPRRQPPNPAHSH